MVRPLKHFALIAGAVSILAASLGATARAVDSPDVRRRLSEQGVDPGASSPEELAARVRSELAKWAKVVKDAGLQVQ